MCLILGFSCPYSLTDSRSRKTLEDLIKDVQEEFDDYNSFISNRNFLSLQACIIDVMNHGGEYGYNISHGHKDLLGRLHQLPKRLKCHVKPYENTFKFLAKLFTQLCGIVYVLLEQAMLLVCLTMLCCYRTSYVVLGHEYRLFMCNWMLFVCLKMLCC
jgi:hypothetical protein